jgi:hypothetical protein
LIGPAIVGGIAELLSLRLALGAIAVAGIMISVLAVSYQPPAISKEKLKC